jgi:hypothetical protein
MAIAKRVDKPAPRSAPNGEEARLESFIEKFAPEHQRLIRDTRKVLQRRFRGANELVYDNYNFFVIGYSPTERASDTIVSLTAAASGLGLCFIRGATRPDPEKILIGEGKQTRFIRLADANILARPEVEAMIASAIERSKVPLVRHGQGTLIIKSISAKQRPRRKSE